jgi:hypothetical protein
MRYETKISRRTFLAVVTAGAALMAGRHLPAAGALWRSSQDKLAARLAGIFTHAESAKVVGLEYAQVYPHEAATAPLLEGIALGVPGGRVALLRASDSELRMLLDHTIREDFAADRVVKLRGWILSTTEARLYALAALA